MTDAEPHVLALAHNDAEMMPLAVDLATALGTDGHTAVGVDRHWLRGPHLRLWLDGTTDATAVTALAEAAAARHRSQVFLGDDAYVKRSVLLGAAELVPGPYLPLRDDNTVSPDPQSTVSAATLIGTTALTLKRRVLAALRPAVAASSSLAAQPAAVRLVPLMIVLAARWEIAGVRSGYLTFRSHLEDHLTLHDESGALRARYAEMLASARPALETLVNSTIEAIALDGTLRRGRYTGGDPVLHAWSDGFGAAVAIARTAADTGTITEDFGDHYAEVARDAFAGQEARWTFDDQRQYSAFHQTLRSLNTLPERANTRQFAAYRFTVNQFLRAATLLDVSPVQRYFSSYVVSELVEEYFGTSWRELLAAGRPGTQR